MQSIQLTEEYKSKLLEMCKELFPKYDKLSISEPQIDVHECITTVALFKENKNFYKTLLGFPNEGQHIHWFEFCMTHLAVKLKRLGIEIDY